MSSLRLNYALYRDTMPLIFMNFGTWVHTYACGCLVHIKFNGEVVYLAAVISGDPGELFGQTLYISMV